MPHHFFIANGSPIAATTRYRCVHLREQLVALGHKTEIAHWVDEAQINPEAALAADLIVLYRLTFCPALDHLIGAAQALGKPVIFDTDDLIFEPTLIAAHRAVKNLSPADQILHLRGIERYLMTLQACDAVLTSTPVLAELARQRGKKAFVHRNSLGEDMFTFANQLHKARPRRDDGAGVIIGYGSGTHTHDVDFMEATGALACVLERFPSAQLWIVGPLTLPDALENLGDRLRRFPLTSWRGWFELAHQMDIALAPLERNNIFCRAKSEIKFVEAGALGVPVVASDVDPYRDSITHGYDGFLAADPRDWIEALSCLIENPERRAEMGAHATETIARRYSPRARTADLARLLPELATAEKTSRLGNAIAE